MTADRYTLDPGARALLADLGVRTADVLRRAALPADLFARTPVTLPAHAYHALWAALEAEAGRPDLPIAIARTVRAEVFQPPVFAALCSPDLEVAARRIAAHKPLVGPIRLGVDVSSDGLTLTPRWPPGITPPNVLVITELLFWVALARMATRADVRPLHVTAPQPPTDRAAYVSYLGVAIAAGPEPAISFSPPDAARPFLTADERMWAYFEPGLARRLSELDDAATTTDRVRAALLELLPAGRPTTGAAARYLALSTRTLQRRLEHEGTTFQAVLDATREALARHHLARSEMPASEIAFLLGYADTSSFYRAFHAWTGQTPQTVRTGSG